MSSSSSSSYSSSSTVTGHSGSTVQSLDFSEVDLVSEIRAYRRVMADASRAVVHSVVFELAEVDSVV
jgi:hypothetical protein